MIPIDNEFKYEGGQTRMIQKQNNNESLKYLKSS